MRVIRTSHDVNKTKGKIKRRVSDELIEVIQGQAALISTDTSHWENVDGLEELVAHSVSGLNEIKQKKLERFEEIIACRQHLNNLNTTMMHMSHISKMTEMSLLMSALGEILEAASTRLGEIERKSMH